MDIIREYGTPMKITYLPKISEHIQNAKRIFNGAIKKFKYKGSYTYCYCTKSSHFQFVVEEALKNGIHLETSSALTSRSSKTFIREERSTRISISSATAISGSCTPATSVIC